jgi:SecD/SecF fusion protein
MVGIASGAYSSIFIASPVLTHWKEREGVYRNRRIRIARELGHVPAYASEMGELRADVEAEELALTGDGSRSRSPRAGRGGRGRRTRPEASLLTPEAPGEQISKDEFQELVADLDIEDVGSRSDPAADLRPEDVVMPSQRGNGTAEGPGKRGKPRKPRNKRHGRAR